jgi:hypothetical protein
VSVLAFSHLFENVHNLIDKNYKRFCVSSSLTSLLCTGACKNFSFLNMLHKMLRVINTSREILNWEPSLRLNITSSCFRHMYIISVVGGHLVLFWVWIWAASPVVSHWAVNWLFCEMRFVPRWCVVYWPTATVAFTAELCQLCKFPFKLALNVAYFATLRNCSPAPVSYGDFMVAVITL